jgi:hypothetical protein
MKLAVPALLVLLASLPAAATPLAGSQQNVPLSLVQAKDVSRGVVMVSFGAPLTVAGSLGLIGASVGAVAVASVGPSLPVDAANLMVVQVAISGVVSAACLATGIPLLMFGSETIEDALVRPEPPSPELPRAAGSEVLKRSETRPRSAKEWEGFQPEGAK